MFKKENVQLYPLYIKLIFDIVVKWESFYIPDEEFFFCISIDKCIEYLFRQLELMHGKVLFSHSIIYMTSFKDGIQEAEIEDILTLDDDVLVEVYEFHMPPLNYRRFPSALWSRIKYDIREYLVEKESEGNYVTYWYHRRFIEVANQYYIDKKSSIERENIFSNVFHFFNETYKVNPKPFKYSKKFTKLYGKEEGQVKRETANQQTISLDKTTGKLIYNKRKITELPRFIARLKSNLAKQFACEHVFFNYKFLCGMFTCSSLNEIIENLTKVKVASSYSMDKNDEEIQLTNELNLMHLIILECGSIIKDFPENVVHILLAHCLQYYNIYKNFTKLIDEYYLEAVTSLNINKSSLLLLYQYLQLPGNDLVMSFDKHSNPITHTVFGSDGHSLLIFTLSYNKFIVFNKATFDEIIEIELDDNRRLFDFTGLIVYLNKNDLKSSKNEKDDLKGLKNFPGGFIVHSKNELISMSYVPEHNDDETIFYRKYFNLTFNQMISSAFLISSEHLLVGFENAKHIEVYNIFNGEKIYEKYFNSPIRFIFSNSQQKNMNHLSQFHNDLVAVYLFIVFDFAELEILKVKINSEYSSSSSSNEIKIELVSFYKFPKAGSHLLSGQFYRSNQNSLKAEFFLMTFCDTNTIGILTLYDLFNTRLDNKYLSLSIKLIKLTGQRERDNKVSFNLLDTYSTKVLLLGSNKCLYFMKSVRAHLIGRIQGSYDSGCFLTSKKIAAISQGTIKIYKIYHFISTKSDQKNCYKFIKISQINAHSDEITFCRSVGFKGLFMTTSRDSTLRLFRHTKLNTETNKNQLKIKFDKTDTDIKQIIHINNNYLITNCWNSK